jgi:SET domain-containing protein
MISESWDTSGKRAEPMDHSELVCVKKAKGKGRGVFARRAIRKGRVIERAPVFIVPLKYLADGRDCPALSKFFYEWGSTTVAVALGYGSLYNHSYTPNARYVYGDNVLVYRALRDIAAGEEITVNYNGTPHDRGSVGFDVV